jgi:hypothetical protein
LSPDLATALRAETPVAPDALRHRVALIAATTPPPPRRISLRRFALVAAPAAGAACLLAAVAVGLKTAAAPDGGPVAARTPLPAAPSPAQLELAPGAADSARQSYKAPVLPAGSAAAPSRTRAQDVRTSVTLLVDDTNDLSGTTQRALRITRRLGGYVQSVQFGSEAAEGTAALRLRIPVSRVQAAVVSFSGLGRILAQQTQITDLQQRLDDLTRQIRRTDDPELRTVLRRQRLELNRRAAYATVSLDLTTQEPQKAVVAPGRLDRAVDDAVGVLAAELAVLAYALIVLSPFLVLLAAAYAGRRAYRRYADLRLLERA